MTYIRKVSRKYASNRIYNISQKYGSFILNHRVAVSLSSWLRDLLFYIYELFAVAEVKRTSANIMDAADN